MKNEYTKISSLGTLVLLLCFALTPFARHVSAEPSTKTYDGSLRVGVLGDTGIGERAYHPGFTAVAKALKNQHPDLLLHLGDFVYQPEIFPKACPQRYIREVSKTLVEPFKFRLFVPGDNDLPPNSKEPKGSGCWEKIDQLDSDFDYYPTLTYGPRPYEGTKILNNTFFAVLNTNPWQDPTPWLAPRIQEARDKDLWIIISLHEPAITSAWYLEKRGTVLKQLNSLKPDLVFAGNQHSYERFHAMGIPKKDGVLPFVPSESGSYVRGDGTIHVIAGGGGATFKPFADQQGFKKRTAPREVLDTIARRALMNHFLILDIKREILKATTYRVCPEKNSKTSQSPKWKPNKPFWKKITLECEGKEPGVTVFDQFQIKTQGRKLLNRTDIK